MEALAGWNVEDKPSWPRVVAAALILLVLLAAPALFFRAGVEKPSPVALVVDGEEVEALALATGGSVDEVLARLKEAGATGVGLYELTLADLAERRPFFVATKATLEAARSPVAARLPDSLPGGAWLLGWNDPLEPWLEASLSAHLSSVGERLHAPGYDGAIWLLDPEVRLDAVGVGFDLDEADAIRRAGLEVVLRPRDDARAAEALSILLSQIETVKPLAVVFSGGAVTGYPWFMDEVAGALRTTGTPLGLIEFTVQRGADYLAKAVGYRVLRVHSIAPHELGEGFSREAALDRWLRAARERRATLLYVRMPSGAAEDAGGENDFSSAGAPGRFEAYLAYVAELARRLGAAGFSLGAPVPIEPPPLYWPGVAAAVAGVAAAGGLLGSELWGRRSGWPWLVAAASVGAFGLLWLKGYTVLARQGAALGAALVFPVLSVHIACGRAASAGAPAPSHALARGLASFGAAAAVTLAGAVLLTALLGDVRFLVKVEEFRGVKAAHLLPPLAVAAIWARPHLRRRSWREWLGAPLQVRDVLLALAAAALLAVYLLRTGNDGLPVPAVEDALRRALEETFVARPRTKEFLLGHPALVAGLALRAQGESKLSGALLALGSIGQVSILNTFAHAHTPLLLSALRTGYGLILGLPLGAAAFFFLNYLRSFAPRRAGTPAAGRVSE